MVKRGRFYGHLMTNLWLHKDRYMVPIKPDAGQIYGLNGTDLWSSKDRFIVDK